MRSNVVSHERSSAAQSSSCSSRWEQQPTFWGVCCSVSINYVPLSHTIMREFFNHTTTSWVQWGRAELGSKTPPVGVQVSLGHMTLHLLKNNDFDFKINNELIIIIITGEVLY